MKKLLALGTCVLLLGGCALPLPVQVASWALDGISYIATHKSLSDHGLSLVAQKDCAVIRGLLLEDGNICRNNDDDAAILVAGVVGETPEDLAGARTLLAELIEAKEIAEFETAAGGPEMAAAYYGYYGNDDEDMVVPAVPADAFDLPPLTEDDVAAVAPRSEALIFEDGVALDVAAAAAPDAEALIFEDGVALDVIPEPLVFEDGVAIGDVPLDGGGRDEAVETATVDEMGDSDADVTDFETAAGMSDDISPPVMASDISPPVMASDFAVTARPVDFGLDAQAVAEAASEPKSGFYFVIGSFREHASARQLRSRYRVLTPSVLAATIERGVVYRVVVGPFDQTEAQRVHKQIYQAGISDSWAIRVKPGEWSMAMVDPPAEAPRLAALESPWWNPMGYIRLLTDMIY